MAGHIGGAGRPERGPITLRTMFEELNRDRNASLNRKYRQAEITLPGILPPEGAAQHQDLPVPFNSMTAEGINNLAARLVSVILPLNNLPVFELFIDEEFNPAGKDTTQVETVMRRVERATMARLYLTNLRPQLFLALKHLITVGDILMIQLPDLDIRLHRADEYVVKRTTEGVWREIIIREQIDPELNPELNRINPKGTPGPQAGVLGFPQSSGSSRRFEPLYSRLTRDGENKPVRMVREFRGMNVPMNGNTFQVTAHMPLRWAALAGEDYGISLVEEQFGDIRSLDATSAGLIDGIAMASEYRWLVNPSGITEIGDVRESVNGDWIAATKDDVVPSSFANAAQINAMLAVREHGESRVGRRFLMNSAAQPTGDRVTAKIVTVIAEELEQALGGVLSMVNRDIMIPLVLRTLFQLSQEDQGIFPKEFGEIIKNPKGVLKLRIRAGLELLQREADRERLLDWLQIAATLPPAAQRVYKWENVGTRVLIASGIEPEGLVKSKEELAAEDEAALQQQQALSGQEAAQDMAINAAKASPEGESPGATA